MGKFTVFSDEIRAILELRAKALLIYLIILTGIRPRAVTEVRMVAILDLLRLLVLIVL